VQSTLGTRLGALLAWNTYPCHYIVGLLCAEYAGYQAMYDISKYTFVPKKNIQ